MDDASSAGERAEKTDHEIDGVIRGKNAEIADARPKRIERGERDALFEIILVRHHAALWTAACTGGVDDAGYVFSFARDEHRFGGVSKFFPALRAGEFGVRRTFGHQHQLDVLCRGTFRRIAELAPNGIFGYQYFSTGMFEQLPVFDGSELVIERHENAAGEKNRIGGDEPLRLVRHDDGSAIAGDESHILQGTSKRVSAALKVFISQTLFFAVAVSFDQTSFGGKGRHRILQRSADRLIFGKVQH